MVSLKLLSVQSRHTKTKPWRIPKIINRKLTNVCNVSKIVKTFRTKTACRNIPFTPEDKCKVSYEANVKSWLRGAAVYQLT